MGRYLFPKYIPDFFLTHLNECTLTGRECDDRFWIGYYFVIYPDTIPRECIADVTGSRTESELLEEIGDTHLRCGYMYFFYV